MFLGAKMYRLSEFSCSSFSLRVAKNVVKEVATSKAFAVHEQFYPAVIYLSTDKICLAVMYNFVPSPQLDVTRKLDLKRRLVVCCTWTFCTKLKNYAKFRIR